MAVSKTVRLNANISPAQMRKIRIGTGRRAAETGKYISLGKFLGELIDRHIKVKE